MEVLSLVCQEREIVERFPSKLNASTESGVDWSGARYCKVHGQ